MELYTLDFIITLIFIIKSFGCKTNFRIRYWKMNVFKMQTLIAIFAIIPPESLPDPDSPSSSSSESFSSSLSISFIFCVLVKSVFDNDSFEGLLNLIWWEPKHTVIVSSNNLRIFFNRVVNFSTICDIGNFVRYDLKSKAGFWCLEIAQDFDKHCSNMLK